jgi:hypothetical protein
VLKVAGPEGTPFSVAIVSMHAETVCLLDAKLPKINLNFKQCSSSGRQVMLVLELDKESPFSEQFWYAKVVKIKNKIKTKPFIIIAWLVLNGFSRT